MPNHEIQQKTYHKKASGSALATVRKHSKDNDLKLFGSCFWLVYSMLGLLGRNMLGDVRIIHESLLMFITTAPLYNVFGSHWRLRACNTSILRLILIRNRRPYWTLIPVDSYQLFAMATGAAERARS
jgi:hypothetical protein